MKIRKDIVDNFNRQIDKQLKEVESDIRRYAKKPGFGVTVRDLINKKLKLHDMRRLFNNFSETGVVVFETKEFESCFVHLRF